MCSNWYSQMTFNEQHKGLPDELWEYGEVKLVSPRSLRRERWVRQVLGWAGRRLLAWGALLTKRSEVAAGSANARLLNFVQPK
jgi:hypothetical protein